MTNPVRRSISVMIFSDQPWSAAMSSRATTVLPAAAFATCIALLRRNPTQPEQSMTGGQAFNPSPFTARRYPTRPV